MPQAVSSLDSLFWRLETPTTPQTIASFCILADQPDVGQFFAKFEEVVALFPRMRRRIVGRRNLVWEDVPDFTLTEHVQYLYIPNMQSVEDLVREAEALYNRPLAKDRPLWNFYLISNRPLSPNESVADLPVICGTLFCLHHSFADGMGGLEVVNAVCGTARSPEYSDNTTPESSSSVWADLKSALPLLPSLLRRKARSSLSGKNSPRRELRILPLPLDSIRAIRHQFGVALNDVLLAIICDGLRRYHLEKNLPLESFKVIMPSSSRGRRQQLSLGNHLVPTLVHLPLEVADPLERLQRINQQTAQLKDTAVQNGFAAIARLNAALPRLIQRRLMEAQARRTNCICTNMPQSPRLNILAGVPVLENYGLPAPIRDHGVAFSVITYAGKACISTVSDPAVLRDPDHLLHLCGVAASDLSTLRPADEHRSKQRRLA